AGGNVLVGVVLLVVHRVLARGRHGSRTSAVRTTAARAARTTAACGTGILVLRLPEGVGGGRRCAVVHGDLRRPIRTLRTLSGDLEVPVLDVDLAVGTGTIDPLVRLTPGPLGPKSSSPASPSPVSPSPKSSLYSFGSPDPSSIEISISPSSSGSVISNVRSPFSTVRVSRSLPRSLMASPVSGSI